jgi:hypothetical protein
MMHAAEDAAALLATLSDQQVATARRRFERDNRKFAKERGVGAPAQEQRRMRAKHDLDTVEHWSGPLDREQKARFAAMSEALPLDAEWRLQDRLRRQNDFIALIQARKDAAFPAHLRAWMLDWDAQRPPNLAAELARYSDARTRMFLAIHEALRPEQRAKVVEQLRWYVDAMRDLSHSPQQAAAQASVPQP